MRKPLVLITLFTLGVVYTSVAQQLKKASTTSFQVATSLSPEKIQEIQKQIAQIDEHFQAIETKKAFVLSDSVKATQVVESGWLENMEAIQQRLLLKKTNLLLILNGEQND